MNNLDDESGDPKESVIAPNTVLKGTIDTENDVRVYGKFDGKISCRWLLIEEHGEVVGDVDAETVKVAGQLTGDVTTDNLLVSQTATLEGDIVALRYGVEPGAQIKQATLNSPEPMKDSNRSAAARRHPRVVMSHSRGGVSRPTEPAAS